MAMTVTLSKAQVAIQIRRELAAHVIDDAALSPAPYSIYTLSDPRTLREVRYVGQTATPARRYRQHLHTARLWLPDTTPWWIASPRLRPLYTWLRALHRDGYRLPVMLLVARAETEREALRMEREFICEHLARGSALLNVEYATLGQQLALEHHRD
jgi:hypothetical protein